MLGWILLATLVISAISLVGLIFSHKFVKKMLHYFISFAAGTLIAVAFFDLIPHALEEMINVEEGLVFVVGGIILFFIIERYIHWHHCDRERCEDKPAGILILTGDFVHNFLDGLLIAGSFMLDVSTGIFTSVTIAIHEIPQEFGDYAVLLHSGFTRYRALLLNFLSALSAVIGGVVGFFLFESVRSLSAYAVLLAAGGFLYVALSDIVPSLHKHRKNQWMLLAETAIFVGTIVGMFFLLAHAH